MTETVYTVILVQSTNHALRAEKILQGADVACRLIPVPRHLSSDCGVCIRVRRADEEQAVKALKAARVETVGTWPI
jgi:hypothetical protein